MWSLVEVLVDVHRRDREEGGSVIGSAIAFRLFLFFVPFLLFFVRLVGVVTNVDAPGLSRQAELSGDLNGQVGTALERPGASRLLALVLCLCFMIWAGRGLGKALVAASCLAWGMPATARAPIRVVASLAGMLASISLVSIAVTRVRIEWGLGASVVAFAWALVWYAGAWYGVFYFLPRHTDQGRVLVPGVVLVATALASMQAVSQLFLPTQFGRADALYGALGATLVTLAWFLILGRVVVYGMTLNAVLAEPRVSA